MRGGPTASPLFLFEISFVGKWERVELDMNGIVTNDRVLCLHVFMRGHME